MAGNHVSSCSILPSSAAARSASGPIGASNPIASLAPGDFFYVPAGTVHAIGPGLSLIEIQQNSDITYRLFDYGRPRELHLDAGIAVAQGRPHDPDNRRHVPLRGAAELVDGPHFRLDRLDGPPSTATAARYNGPLLVLPLDTPLEVAGERAGPGQCALALSLDEVNFEGRSLIAQPC